MRTSSYFKQLRRKIKVNPAHHWINSWAGTLLLAMAVWTLPQLAHAAEAIPDYKDVARKVQSATVCVERVAYALGLNEELRVVHNPLRRELTSGAIISPDGLIVSYGGLIGELEEEPAQLQARLPDGRRLPAKLLVRDERTALCLLQVEASELAHLPLAEVPPQVGERVFVASCSGAEPALVSAGTIGAVDRVMTAGLPPLLQADVRTSGTSAGAPMVNANGQLVGVVLVRERPPAAEHMLDMIPGGPLDAAAPPGPPGPRHRLPQRWHGPSGFALEPGWTFAVPVDQVRAILHARQDDQTVVIPRNSLGVQLRLNPDEGGAEVIEVRPDSPADQAGIQQKDRIKAIDERPITSPQEASAWLMTQLPGAEIKIRVDRNGQEQVLTATLAERPSDYGTTSERTRRPRVRVEVLRDDRLEVHPRDDERFSLRLFGGTDHGEGGGLVLEVPRIRVQRGELDEEVDELREEVESLRDEVHELRREIRKLRHRKDRGPDEVRERDRDLSRDDGEEF